MKTAPDLQSSPTEAPPTEILTLVRQGKDALEKGDLDLALTRFEEVVVRFPERPEGHNNLGALYTSLGRFDKAESCFDRVLETLPGNPNVLYNRGIVRIRLKKFDEAIEDFKQVLAASAEDADSWNNLGVATFMKGDPDSSRPYFQKALELVPNFPNALLNLCDAEASLGSRALGISRCQQFLSQFRNPEVQGKLLELSITESTELIGQACTVAESLLVENPADDNIRQQLDRLNRARVSLCGPSAGS
jgi:tetratricopeptide (TPR) repeat protein